MIAGRKELDRGGAWHVLNCPVGLEESVRTKCCRCLAFFSVLCVSPLCFGQVVKVRVVDASDEHPLVRQNVSVVLMYGQGEPAPAHAGTNLNLHFETDAHGEAQFRLPEPNPRRLLAQVRLRSEYWHAGVWRLSQRRV